MIELSGGGLTEAEVRELNLLLRGHRVAPLYAHA